MMRGFPHVWATPLLKDQLAATSEKAEDLATRARDLELALAQSQAKIEAQQDIAAELRAYLDTRERPTASEAR